MTQIAQCLECGNARGILGACPYCQAITPPSLDTDSVELNIKEGNPTVEEALERLSDNIRQFDALGIKAIVLIHGYGSSGEGGLIKRAIHEALENNRFADRVEDYYFGEQVSFGSQAYQNLMKRRPGLRRFIGRFKAGNAGISILLLGTSHRNA